MPSTAPSKSLVRAPSPASYTENLIEEDPLFKTKTGKKDMQKTSKDKVGIGASVLQASASS
jgi:hypothetical protein